MIITPARRMQGIQRTLIRRIFDAAPADALNLGLGQPDLPTPDAISLAGIAGIVEHRTGYSSTAGDPALRAALAERYHHAATGPESILVTVGSQEAMVASCLTRGVRQRFRPSNSPRPRSRRAPLRFWIAAVNGPPAPRTEAERPHIPTSPDPRPG